MDITIEKSQLIAQSFPTGPIKADERILFQAIEDRNILFTLASSNYGGSDREITLKASEVTVNISSDLARRVTPDRTKYKLVRFNPEAITLAEGKFVLPAEITSGDTEEKMATVQPTKLKGNK